MSEKDVISELKEAVNVFETEYTKYVEKGVNSSGSKSRKALMQAKKAINSLRKTILADQKSKKTDKKAAKDKKKSEE